MAMMKDLKVYLPFAKNSFQRLIAYKANVIMFMFGDGLMLAVTYYLWRAIYESSTSEVINGFTMNEMIIYVIISFLTMLITSVDISYPIAEEVKNGSIAVNLIRPISYEKRMFFQGLGNVFYNFVVIFIIAFSVTVYLSFRFFGSIGIGRILVYLLSIILGVFISFYFSYIFGLISFKITNMWGLSQVMGAISNLLSGTLIPIVFFPEILQKLFNFLPFGSMIYTPTMIYLGKLTGVDMIKSLIIQAVWIFILIGIAKLMWKTLIKKLTILGG